MLRSVALCVLLLLTTACAVQPTPPAGSSGPTSGSSGKTSNANKTRPYVVLGKRYTPLTTSEGYVERGVASWYGPKFDGRPTANGEVFDMHQMTAAHKTLPLPCYVLVTNLRNGRQVTLRVNDRGPFVDNRLIDLSYAAAVELDIVGPGTSLVEVRVVPNPDREVVTAPAVVTNQATPSEFYIQVGAFSVMDNAENVRRTLQRAGLNAVVQQRASSAGTTLHRVRVGPVSSVEHFDALIAKLESLGYGDARLAND